MSKYGILLDYGHGFNLDPFPIIPAGAMYAQEHFIVTCPLNMLHGIDVDSVIAATEIGAAFLSDAIASYEGYRRMDFIHLPEIEPLGSGNLVKQGIVSAISDYTSPIALVGSNVLTDLNLRDLERFHLESGRPPATVVLVPGKNDSSLGIPKNRRPVEIMMLERSIVKYGTAYPSGKALSIRQLLEAAGAKDKVAYYMYDGFMYEVDSEEAYSSLLGVSA
jgi:hypothetical protein